MNVAFVLGISRPPLSVPTHRNPQPKGNYTIATSAARIRYFKSLELPTLIDGVSATNSNRKQNKILNALALMRQLRCAPLVSLGFQHNTNWADCPERITLMFGQMMVEPVVQIDPGVDLQTAVAALITVADNVEIVRWIELPASVLLFLLVPGDPDSGAVYVLDRKKGTWYAVDFEDEQFGGYSVSQLEMLLKECNFLDLMERPGLWRSGLRWVVLPGMRPEAAV